MHAWFRKPSIRAILVAVVVAAFAATATLGAVLYVSWENRRATNDRVNQEVASITTLQELRAALLAQGGALSSYYAVRTDVHARDFRDSRKRAEAALAELRLEALALDPEDTSAIDQLAADFKSVSDQEETVLVALERGDVQGAIVLTTTPTDLTVAAPALQTAVEVAITEERDQLAAEQRADNAAQRTVLWLIFGIAGIAALLTSALAIASLRWLVKPLELASRAASELAAGDLTARLSEAGPRELARLGSNVNEMAAA